MTDRPSAAILRGSDAGPRQAEAGAPLLRLLSLVATQMATELGERLVAAGHDHGRRFAFNAVFANVPPEGIRLTDLAQRAGVTKQAMSELVVELEGLGYLARRPDPSDRRARLIEFTDRGWASVRDALDAFRTMEAELTQRIGQRRMAALRETLLDLLDD